MLIHEKTCMIPIYYYRGMHLEWYANLLRSLNQIGWTLIFAGSFAAISREYEFDLLDHSFITAATI